MSKLQVGIINIEIGNIGSVANMIKKIGYEPVILSDISEIQDIKTLILPGVGSYDNGVDLLKKSGWFDVIKNYSFNPQNKLIGICLGMQLLCNGSEEGSSQGLDLIPGFFKKFSFDDLSFKVPHMGWNTVHVEQSNNFSNHYNFLEGTKYYFVHSYYYTYQTNQYVIANTNYNFFYPTIIRKSNIYGFQFHPEKSHKYGMRLLEFFLSENASS